MMPITLDERVSVLESQMAYVHSDVRKIGEDIEKLATRFATRPSWGVAAALTFLSSTCVGLIVALATSAN
jgi:hypothetical protein